MGDELSGAAAPRGAALLRKWRGNMANRHADSRIATTPGDCSDKKLEEKGPAAKLISPGDKRAG